MTEDEAFIRVIVDSPGDDTPRLVYADWLDERDDPRGPYVRAETEWAKPWRGGRRPDATPEFLGAAAGIDPVWVARVSRPPVGVCFDHFEMKAVAPPVSESDLAVFEQKQRLILTPDYRGFLLNRNGGSTPNVRFVDFTSGLERGISHFNFVRPVGSKCSIPDDWSSDEVYGVGEDDRIILAIGGCGDSFRQLALDLGLSACGDVLFFVSDIRPQHRALAPSFAAFLNVVYLHKYR